MDPLQVRKFVLSPDTDTYHVGMGLLEDARMTEYLC